MTCLGYLAVWRRQFMSGTPPPIRCRQYSKTIPTDPDVYRGIPSSRKRSSQTHVRKRKSPAANPYLAGIFNSTSGCRLSVPYRIIFISKPTGATKEEGRSSSAPLQDEISPIACVAVHAQHDSSDGSVVKAFAAIRMPSAMVR